MIPADFVAGNAALSVCVGLDDAGVDCGAFAAPSPSAKQRAATTPVFGREWSLANHANAIRFIHLVKPEEQLGKDAFMPPI